MARSWAMGHQDPRPVIQARPRLCAHRRGCASSLTPAEALTPAGRQYQRFSLRMQYSLPRMGRAALSLVVVIFGFDTMFNRVSHPTHGRV